LRKKLRETDSSCDQSFKFIGFKLVYKSWSWDTIYFRKS